MSFKSLNKTIIPIIKSMGNIQTTVVKSIVQKNHSLKGDLIVILIIIASIVILQQLFYFYNNTYIIEGQSNLLDKSEQKYIKRKCNETNKSKVCNALTSRGVKKCSKFHCCAWVKYEKGAKCVHGNETGPMINSSKNKFDEYYYLGKKYKLKK